MFIYNKQERYRFLASRQGFEPRPTVLETDMLPLHQRDTNNFGGPEGNRTPTRGLQSHCAPIITTSPNF